MRRMLRAATVVSAAVAIATAAACGGGITENQRVSLAGQYTPVRYTFREGRDSAWGGWLRMNAVAYAESVDLQVPVQSGHFAFADSGTYTATQSGTLTMSNHRGLGKMSGTYTLANGVMTWSLTPDSDTSITKVRTEVWVWKKQ